MKHVQVEAIRLYNALALSDKLRLDILLQPGDIQLLSNHTQLHTRSAFVDYAVRSCTFKPRIRNFWHVILLPASIARGSLSNEELSLQCHLHMQSGNS